MEGGAPLSHRPSGQLKARKNDKGKKFVANGNENHLFFMTGDLKLNGFNPKFIHN